MINKLYTLSLLTLLLLASCAKQLDFAPPASGTVETFYKTQLDFLQATNALYNAMRTYPDRLINMSESRSDNLYAASVLGTQPYDALNSFRANIATNQLIETAWLEDFNGVFKANLLLEQLEINGTAVESVALRTRMKAEAMFFRAFFYFDLVRYFGKVPLTTKTVTALQATTIPRSPVAEVYTQIIADLKFAIDNLSPAYTGADVGRASKYAAQSLLGLVYMTRSGPTYSIEGPGLGLNEWTEAMQMFDEVIKSNVFAFNTSYANVFSYSNQSPATNKEAILSVMNVNNFSPVLGASFVTLTIPDAYFTSALKAIAQLGGPGRPTSYELYNSYDASDVRRTFNFRHYFTDLGIPGNRPYLIKYMDSTKVPLSNPRDWPINFMAIRYTDILLMKAEAILHGAAGGRQATADSIVNLVRRRAGLGNTSNVTLAQLYNERRKELHGEGSRWFDLQRNGTIVSTMNNWKAAEDVLNQVNPMIENFIIYPVPQSQLDAMPGLYTPNPGYN